MRIKQIHLEQFKRFTNFTITDLPSTAKLVVLLGPNGCGKSSLFDGFKAWHLLKGYQNYKNNDYYNKPSDDQRPSCERVNISFYENTDKFTRNDYHQLFYFRTAYRNSPSVSIRALEQVYSPLEKVDDRMMIQNDSTVNENYQRLVSKTISLLYNKANDEKKVSTLRDELLSRIREPLHRLFPDLLLTEIGVITDKAEFYFSKGTTEKYGYEKLSGGEKAAFDLLLDFVIKQQYYQNTIFCIDEPETHIHTALQAKLLSELFNQIPDQSQLWIATHSFGMMKEAKKIMKEHPDEVVFLNFDGYDFDDTVILRPSKCDTALWNKMLEITLDDYSTFLSPEIIVFCEGTSRGRQRKDFDARCYAEIFKETYPNTLFYSLGGCNDVQSKNALVEFIQKLSPNSRIIKVIDRDDRSETEIADLQREGVKVLSLRHLECFLLDDVILKKWCIEAGKSEKQQEVLNIKQQKIQESINRGNPADDIKSASNDICSLVKKELGVTSCGNTPEMIMRDTLAKLVTPDTRVYQQLEDNIFN